MLRRHCIVAALIASLVALACGPARAVYPERPIIMIVPFAAGGPADIIARILATTMSKSLGQNVIVDNRAGAGGNLGIGLVARANPDGYTLLLSSTAIAVNAGLFANLPYDPIKDFAPISELVNAPNVLFVRPDSGITSIADLVAKAKADPDKFNYSSPGVGTKSHLTGELLKLRAGINIQHVPYRGGGAAVNDLLGGHISMAFLSLSAAVPHMTTGKIKIVAMVEKTRYAAMPDIPTIGETVPGFEMSSWLGIFAPAGTPADIVAKLNDGIAKVLSVDGVKQKLGNLGLVVVAGKPEELANVVKDGLKVRGELVKAAGIQPE